MTDQNLDDPVAYVRSMAVSLENLALTALAQANVISIEVGEDGKIIPTILSAEERASLARRPTRVLPGETSTLWGDEGPLAWVLTPPAPFNDVEIACSPDDTTGIGMRCHATKKLPGARRVRYRAEWHKEEDIT